MVQKATKRQALADNIKNNSIIFLGHDFHRRSILRAAEAWAAAVIHYSCG
jgi:hypothetical protein